jgi:hypothetical protein
MRKQQLPDSAGNRKLDSLAHYLMPALDDLRRYDMGFESYLLEMVILALKDRDARAERSLSVREVVPV